MSLPHASRLLSVSVIAAALLLSASRLRAVDGDVRMHDPSTIIQADGKFYVYGALIFCDLLPPRGGRSTYGCIDASPHNSCDQTDRSSRRCHRRTE